MDMNINEIRSYVRDTAAKTFIENFPDARGVLDKDYTYIVPVVLPNGETGWAKFGITSLSVAATKVREAFDVNERTAPAAEVFANMLAEREANQRAKEAEKAANPKRKKKSEEDA